ncbi:MAG: DUF3237 domain-containing protein [Actinobacteria bacterium]|nr:DUF3237 domain-containing protein [Actinomycetota bacterium]
MPETYLTVEALFTITITTSPPVMIPDGPQGGRMFVAVTGGTFEGDRLRGTVLAGSGGDYLTLRSNGTMKLDVRLILTTDDGANILMTYTGVGASDADGFGLRTAPLFETGEPRYAWLNDLQAIAIGELTAEGVMYHVYELK